MQSTQTPIEEPRLPLFKEPNILGYLGGQLISLSGSTLQISVISLMIVAIVGKELAPAIIGDVIAAGYLPGVFLAIFAGIWLDTVNMLKVLKATSVLGAIQGFTLAYLAMGDVHSISILQLKGLSIFLGFVNAIDAVARNGVQSHILVDRRNTQKAATLFTSLYIFAQVIGGGMAAFLISHIGYASTYAINGISYLVLILTLGRIKYIRRKASGPWPKTPNWKESIREGAKHTFCEPGIRICIILTALLCIFGFSYNALLPIIAKGPMFNGGNELYSQFAAWAGIGSLLACGITLIFGKKLRMLVVSGNLILGTNLVLLAKTSDAHAAKIIMFFIGLGCMLSLITTRTAITHIAAETAKHCAARVQGFTITIFFGGMMIGSYAAGHIAKAYGCPVVLMFCGIAVIAIALVTPIMPGADEIK
ncbi:MAG: permease [Candidatus Taylorbacteria bacterium]|nr:permease [Candidatus Taylorbacteria bacterium]